MYKLSLLALCLSIIISCSLPDTDKKGYSLKINTKNAEGHTVFLDVLELNNFTVIDSGVVADEKVAMGSYLEEKSICRLRFDDSQFLILLLANGDVLNIKIDLDDFENYTVEESSENMMMKDLMRQVNMTYGRINEIQQAFQSELYAEDRNDVVLERLQDSYVEVITEHQQYITSFVDTQKNPFLAIFAVDMLDPEQNSERLNKLADMLKKDEQVANSTYVKAFIEKTARRMLTSIGNKAPDIVMPTSNGDTVRLSSLSNKLILIDFWASWCRPCREQNPELVRIYKKYKKQGLAVYGVSLDKDKESWLEAIKDDHLDWDVHVSELNAWKSSIVEDYSISAIPANYLLDSSGTILAKNLENSALEEFLTNYFDKSTPAL